MNKFRDTVTLLRAPIVTSAYGNSGRDWSIATETASPANVQGPSGGEDFGEGDRVTSRWRLFLPGGVNLEPTDRVRWNGEVYEIDGEVFARRDKHVKATLARVTQEVG